LGTFKVKITNGQYIDILVTQHMAFDSAGLTIPAANLAASTGRGVLLLERRQLEYSPVAVASNI
jgi:hypothetical protein